jgi:stress response protein SCP2
MKHPSGQIWLTGDNRTGEGDGDDEQIIVKLNSLDEKYQKILFVVSIYQGKKNNQHFGMIDNAFIRAVDAKGKEITKYSLSGDESMNGMCSMIFSEVYRKDGEWKFRAIGDPQETDNFVEILKRYIN